MSLLRRMQNKQDNEQPGKPPEPQSSEPRRSRLDDMKRPKMSPVTDLKSRLLSKILAELAPSLDTRSLEARYSVEELFNAKLSEEDVLLASTEKTQLFEAIFAEIAGFGPLESLLNDESIREIMVNGAKNIFIMQKGRLTRSTLNFENDAHILKILDRLLALIGQHLDMKTRIVNTRLPNGIHLNAVLPPISQSGPTITIRKLDKRLLSVEDLIRFGSMTEAMAEFLRACVVARINIVVSGGGGSGKTTLLNILSNFIPNDERIVTVESTAELQLRQEHTVTLLSHPLGFEAQNEVNVADDISVRDLVINVLNMRPDRIVIGEVRSGEALDMLQAMNAGYNGAMLTVHSNSTRDTLARLEVMCLMSGMDLPIRAIREQIASAVNLIVHIERLRDGTRKVVRVAEVQGMEGDIIILSDIFEFEQTGMDAGKVIGRIRPTGLRPKFLEQLNAAGVHLSPSIFGIGISRPEAAPPAQENAAELPPGVP